MLHIRQRTTAAASWAARGYPALMRWKPGRPEVPLLYWALNEVGAAVASEDIDAINDLLDEAELLLERIWTEPVDGSRRRRDVMAISTGLWSEVQRGRGASDLTEVALHARLLRSLVAPATGQLAVRPPEAVAPYRPAGERIRGGRLPLTGRTSVRGRVLPEQFLLLLALVLSNGRGHLVDSETGRIPRGTDPAKVGWKRPDQPAGVRLGSIRGEDLSSADLFLRPRPCLNAVTKWVRRRPVIDADRWSVDDIGWALAATWLTDTTLVIEPKSVVRLHTAPWPVVADQASEPVWRMPLGIYHPHQLHSGTGGWRTSPTPLRPVPDR